MINTVLGKINASDLGVTLMHEHIAWDSDGAKSTNEHNIEEVAHTMIPYLLAIKESGCKTFVDATTFGSGRDVRILIECAERTNLNILTNTGAWDGGSTSEKYIPNILKDKRIDEMSNLWISEYYYGIDGTAVKPAYIKIALGDEGVITEFQEKILRAAVRTSLETNMPIQCHMLSSYSAIQAIKIIEEEHLPLNKFIWVHGDFEQNPATIIELAKKGIWVELDFLARQKEFSWYPDTIKKIKKNNLLNRILISQDAGTFYFNEKNDKSAIFPFNRIFEEFIPYCINNGISHETFHKLLVENPIEVLDID